MILDAQSDGQYPDRKLRCQGKLVLALVAEVSLSSVLSRENHFRTPIALQVSSGRKAANSITRSERYEAKGILLRFRMQVEIASGGKRAIDAFRLGSLA